MKILRINNIIYNLLSPLHHKRCIEDLVVARNYLNDLSPKPSSTNCGHNNIISSTVDLQIIIPIFNAKEYIVECLQSILTQQTKFSFHIILVDDGSSDHFETVLGELLKDERLTLIHQKSNGAASARNRGLNKLFGKYVMFVDSDDKLIAGAIQKLLQTAYSENFDIVEGGYITFKKKRQLSKAKHKNEVCNNAIGTLWGFVWGKVIRSELFEHVIFPEGYWFEDTNISYLIYTRCQSAYTIEDIVYGYRNNPKGFSHIKGGNLKLIDTYWIIEQIITDMNILGVVKEQFIYEKLLYSIYISAQRTRSLNYKIKRYIFVLFARIINDEFTNFRSSNTRFKNLEAALRKNDYYMYVFYTSLV